MFDILKKKITGLVGNITKNILGEKKHEYETTQEIKEKQEINSKEHEEIKTKELKDNILTKEEKNIMKKDNLEINEKIKEKPEVKETEKIKEEIIYREETNAKETEKKTDKKDIKPKISENKSIKKIEELIKESEKENKIETKEKTEEKKEAEKPEIKVKTSLITKVKSFIVPEVTIKEEDVTTALEDFELQLLTADVALPVAEEIVSDLKNRIVGQKIKSNELEKYIINSIHDAVYNVMQKENIDLISEIKKARELKKPYKILFIGPNGAGKTTTIAKVAHYLKKNGISCVISASDTFRAAAIEQAVEHAKRLNIPYIKHDYGSDPAAVAFDSIKYAEAHNIDVVLIDSAGRQETNRNLIEQLKKIERVTSPNLKVFVGEGITGNALLNQVSEFNSAIKLDGVILTKLDVDAKGGTVISIRKATGLPILFIGVGQEYDDLIPFDKEYIIKRIMNN